MWGVCLKANGSCEQTMFIRRGKYRFYLTRKRCIRVKVSPELRSTIEFVTIKLLKVYEHHGDNHKVIDRMLKNDAKKNNFVVD